MQSRWGRCPTWAASISQLCPSEPWRLWLFYWLAQQHWKSAYFTNKFKMLFLLKNCSCRTLELCSSVALVSFCWGIFSSCHRAHAAPLLNSLWVSSLQLALPSKGRCKTSRREPPSVSSSLNHPAVHHSKERPDRDLVALFSNCPRLFSTCLIRKHVGSARRWSWYPPDSHPTLLDVY